MNLSKLFFALTVLGIIILVLANFLIKPNTGEIEKISFSTGKTTIQLQNESRPLIVFSRIPLALKENDKVQYWGKEEIYKNQAQIIADKIKKIR